MAAEEHANDIKVKDTRFWTEEGQAQATTEDAAPPVSPQDPARPETRAFEAETQELLELMIHSLYSEKEIFLRELISNASDALDRLRYEAVTRPELQGDKELTIRLDPDPKARTLTIEDNGIGMSRDEVVKHIGTIAKSGTRELVQRIKGSSSQEEAQHFIGQFGVGFYSTFMVADKVKLVTRRAGETQATEWESSGDGTYRVGPGEREGQGTTITLHLKPVDAENGVSDFTTPMILRRIVKQYSDFVRYPIKMKVTRLEGEKTITEAEEETVNSMKAIWTRRKEDVTEDEYAEFYKHVSHDWEKPLKTVSLSAEGRIEYRALLFMPSHAPYDLFYAEAKHGLQLYVRQVKIMETCADVLPTYLRFVRGVVDSPDLPLNVSREILQKNREITQIRRGITKKVLDTLATMLKDDRETYLTLWKEFGRVLKEGVTAEAEVKDKVIDLFLFQSSADPVELTTLAQYRERMKSDQDEIYYLTGDSRASIEGSPHLEAFRAKGIEVLYLTDPVDEFMLQWLHEYDHKKLKSVGKGEVELGSEEERKKAREAKKELEDTLSEFLKAMKKSLEDVVEDVRLSNRLTDSPACLVSSVLDPSPHFARLLKQTRAAENIPDGKRILEVNATHPIMEKLRARFETDSNDSRLRDDAHILYAQALLAEGSEIPEPARYAKLIADLMVRAAG